jgi:SAM-dependent methyltransferase
VRLDDPDIVRKEYASERGLATRKAAYRFASGPDPRQVAFEAVAERSPRRVLEVGCGEGELAERIKTELGCEVVAVDQSERMVELTRARGVDAQVGDVQALAFDDAEFDCAVAAWMLYHVPDLDRALVELARVLGAQGRLVAATNSLEHLLELHEALGVDRGHSSFGGQNGEELLRRHFSRVERREAYGWIDFPTRGAAQDYVDATIVLGGLGPRGRLPVAEGPLRVRRAPVVFVADKQ